MKTRYSSSARPERGQYMIEMLIGIATTAMLGAALIGALAETQRMTSASQSQIVAADITQELIDNARNLTSAQLTQLTSSGGTATYTWSNTYSVCPTCQPCSTCSPTTTPDPRPLMMDVSLHWTTYQGQEEPAGPAFSNLFPGAVTETITATNDSTGNPLYFMVNVTSTWNEGAGTRNYSQNALISVNGIHNYE